MSITKKEIGHLARLCRLGLVKNEEEKFQKELSSILGYIEQLKDMEEDEADSASQIMGLENVLRKDEIEAGDKQQETRDKILANAPQLEEDYLKVKAVLDKSHNT